jgi:ATP-binding cassette, subfamily F, member 3
MLTVNHLSKSYGLEPILKDISFSLNPGERLGLVGPNGCGKTTLLRLLAGEARPDQGSFHFSPPDLRLGYLPQGLQPNPQDTLGSFLDRQAGSFEALNQRLEVLAAELAAHPQRNALQHEYDELLARLPLAAESANRAPEVLDALGLGDYPPETPVQHLSGGQKTRLALAGVLLGGPGLLLLDEPTNHLDIDMLEWLEDWLTDPSMARLGALIVSHDRLFLDRTVTGILELDPLSHTLRQFAGNYADYLEQKLSERRRQEQEYADWKEEISRLRDAASQVRHQAAFRKGGKGDSGDKFAKGFFGNRSRRTVGRAKHLEKRLETLLTDEKAEKPRPSWQMKLDFGAGPQGGKDVVMLEQLAIGYDGQALLSGLEGQVRQGQRLALIGPNGAGKTTLLRTIAGQLPPIAGRVRLGPSIRTGYMSQEQETLDPALDALQSISHAAPFNQTAARTFLHQFLFTGDDVFTPVGKLSYGERARLSLALLAASGCNLLLLDEPINHLDIPSRARFEQALKAFEGTVIAVVHDRYFIEGFATAIWEIREGALTIMS